jgi:hypothetical protein
MAKVARWVLGVVDAVIGRSWKARCAKLGKAKVQAWINCARSLARATRIRSAGECRAVNCRKRS